MNCISNFLQKFLALEKNNHEKLLAISDTIRQETGLELSKENLEIKGETLKINVSPVVRNEIFMHREKIESLLKDRKIFLRIV